jgi:Protein of unknown function (DUF429)
VKGLHIFDGQHHHIEINQSRSYINRLREKEHVLVCWDSPLTGPPISVVAGGESTGTTFSKRPIESFFSRSATRFKTPKGISVRSYSGCPHWALSRSLLGLPQVGPFDSHIDSLPLARVNSDKPPSTGRHVVEVHPAVALWLWTRKERGEGSEISWDYKKSPDVMTEIWQVLGGVTHVSHLLRSLPKPNSDDELDAIVAYLLGRAWLDECGAVVRLGNENLGSFLLPKVEGLEHAWEKYNHQSG